MERIYTRIIVICIITLFTKFQCLSQKNIILSDSLNTTIIKHINNVNATLLNDYYYYNGCLKLNTIINEERCYFFNEIGKINTAEDFLLIEYYKPDEVFSNGYFLFLLNKNKKDKYSKILTFLEANNLKTCCLCHIITGLSYKPNKVNFEDCIQISIILNINKKTSFSIFYIKGFKELKKIIDEK